ncbi:DeoR/GlpR family DNA-binding transcription regulator, partial [Mycobacterium kansasii]
MEPRSAQKAVRDTAEKRAIAAVAAGLVEDGMTVAVGAGTTTLELARLLRGRRVSVVTNSISIFHVLTDP